MANSNKKNTSDSPPLQSGQITFFQNHLPALTAGTYEMSVEQVLKNEKPQADRGGDDVIDETYISTKRFVVRGERFSLNPSEFATHFPPSHSQGEFGNVLPHIVFSRKTLPWERLPGGEDPGPSWLALLLFDELDPIPEVHNGQVGDLQRSDFFPAADAKQKIKSSLPSDAVSYPEAFQATYPHSADHYQLDYGEYEYDRCQYIDVPVTLFNSLAPTLQELQWLSHARQVSFVKKAGTKQKKTGDFSVLIGNRLPVPNTNCTVHLVSLEGMAGYLPSIDQKGNYIAPPILLADGTTQASLVRLVSLKNWSFASVDPKESFTGLLEALAVGTLQLDYTETKQGLVNITVQNAFQLGYTAFNHATRQGDHTISWYRGPLLPFNLPNKTTVPLPNGQGIHSADEVVRYNPETGMMDVSYAAAWEVGRLLSLKNKKVAVAIYNWKREFALKTVLAAEEKMIKEDIGASLQLSDTHQHQTAHLKEATAALIAVQLSAVLKDGGPAVAEKPTQPLRNKQSQSLQLFDQLQTNTDPAENVEPSPLAVSCPLAILDWMRRLKLLLQLPFNYIIPDSRMLPDESIRFFQMDFNWVYSLLEGAFSIGDASSSESLTKQRLAPQIHRDTQQQIRHVWNILQTSDAPVQQVTGFFLRSQVVSGWPGLEITPYDKAGNELKAVLRLEHVAPNVLLCMVEGMIDHVDIHEPAEGLHFGIDIDMKKTLRYVTVPAGVSAHPGDEIEGLSTQAVPFRSARVVKIQELSSMLSEALQKAHANDESDGKARPFTAAEFALEMVEGAQSVRFQYKK